MESNAKEGSRTIYLHMGFLSEDKLSMLFFACDAILLPYRITSGSGVMFDALAHGLPFVASDLEFFKEFAEMGLGVVAKRTPRGFADALRELGRNYDDYAARVERFKSQLGWARIAQEHIRIYNSAKAAAAAKRRESYAA